MWQVLGASRFNLLHDLEVGVARALGRGREALLARGLLLPGGRDEAHAAHALDRLQHVDRATDRPPAIAGGLHEAEAPAPLLAVERRGVADQPPRAHV